MPKIACRWCQDKLDLEGNPGWYTCQCKTVSIDIGRGYYRVIANFEDVETIGDNKND